MNLAVIKTGGKQYIVSLGDKIKIERIDGEDGKEIEFSEVLLMGEDKNLSIGEPIVKDAKVCGKILRQDRAKKIIIFKYKAKKRYKKKTGHRQEFTEVEITKVGN
jgi:large subunit ribosomal protein L21